MSNHQPTNQVQTNEQEMPSQTIIVESWRTEIMPASAFDYYHKACFEGTEKPNSKTREIPASDVLRETTCCGCWETIQGGLSHA